jgi:hypothetical protein
MSTLLEAAKAMCKCFDRNCDVCAGSRIAVELQESIAAEEQRIASEQLTATMEWLTEVLGEPEPSPHGNGIYWHRGAATVSIFDTGEVRVGNVILDSPTRRQVLCLLEAMGVKP